jgi:acetyl-CoA carboxylase biotin carboxyl carrier protein
MNADQTQQIAAWLAATDIGWLELHGHGQSLVLRHDGAAVDVVHDAAPPEAATPQHTLTVTAPSVGVFLHRHPLREDPLAVPGTAVRAGQALGLLQIGLLLLPVTSPADATVHELLAAHGAVVGFGTPLVALLAATPA